MKRHLDHGFTLVEMLLVMVIIAVLAAIVLHLNRTATEAGARSRAQNEIQSISAACEAYKSEHGSYPRKAGVTEGTVSGSPPAQASIPLDPRFAGDPRVQAYQNASQFLYGELTGDLNFDGLHQSGEPTQYLAFQPNQLGKPHEPAVAFLKDPFGNSYGYSTAAATDEELFQQALKSNPGAVRSPPHGLNVVPFDLWSTAGLTAAPAPDDPERTWSRWVKNW